METNIAAILRVLATLAATETAPAAVVAIVIGMPQGSAREAESFLDRALCLGLVKAKKGACGTEWALTATGRKVAKGL